MFLISFPISLTKEALGKNNLYLIHCFIVASDKIKFEFLKII